MTKNLRLCLVILLLHITLKGFSQIVVTFPSDRAIFQRNHSNSTDVYIGGFITESFEKIEAHFIPLVLNEGQPAPSDGSWALIDNTIEAGHFYGSMTVNGGWYKLEVRGVKKNGSTQMTTVEHVGVGEVFIVAGQSNATGGDQNPNGPGAKHDQVNSVNFQNLDGLTSKSYSGSDLPCPVYVHLDASVKTAPFGNYAWCWGSFGDQLYEKLKVPVMVFNAGWSSTGIDNWRQSIDVNAQTVSAFGLPFPAGQPFGNLRLALNFYAAQLGVRAILWHQGETDNLLESPSDPGQTYTNYVSSLSQVISATRSLTGKNNLAWMVSRASRYTVNNLSRTSINVINAQNEIVNNNGTYPQVYPGPETDDYYDINYRHDNVHFRGDGVTVDPDGHVYSGLISLAGFWTSKITDDFLTQSEPYAAIPPPYVSAARAGSQITFTGPGISPTSIYKWLGLDCNSSEGSLQSLTVDTGYHKLKITDDNKNIIYSPQLFVSGASLPVTWKTFSAKAGQNGRAVIEWSTASETGSSHFDVERSTDAMTFATIKTVSAAGNSKNLTTYQYEDENLRSGTYYYRLKQIDLDSKFEYTRIENVKINGNFTARAFPNPVKDKLIIEAGESLGLIEVINAAGTKLFSSETQSPTQQINMQTFPSGLYTVTINGKSFKIVK